MITAAQGRAARILLGMSAIELAGRATVGIATVKRFESGQPVNAGTITAIANALTTAGVTFIAAGESSPDGGEGVRLA